MKNYLVVNLGLKSIRLIVFDEAGQQVFVRSKPVFSRLTVDNVEQNAEEWESHLNELLLELKDQTSLASTITHITSTTSSSCIFGVNEVGEPTTRVMMVSDKRSKVQVSEVLLSTAFRNNSVKYGYKCSTSSTVPKILWYKENHQTIYSNTYKWIGASEFIHNFFINKFVTDPLNAGKAFYNGSEYDNDIFKELDINVAVLPEVVEIGSGFDLPNTVSSKYGLPETCKFVISTYDAICAVIGSYDGSHSTACDVSGTVTSLRVLSDKTVIFNDDSVLLSQELGYENKRLIGASNNMGGGIIEWCKQAFYDEKDPNVYISMENSALNSTVGAKGVIFLPYLLGERAPFKSSDAKATFFGISRYSKKDDLTRAVFESTAFVTNDLLNLIVDAGIDIDSISVSGGLARFDIVNQIKADVTNRVVKVLENFESTSVGAFILMSIAIGRYNSIEEASCDVVRIRKSINPSSKNHIIYKSFFDLYKNLNQTLSDSYTKHKDLLSKIEGYSLETISNL